EQRIEELREALGDRYQDIEISVLRICCNRLASDVKNSFSGIILDDVGLNRPMSQGEEENGLVFFSEESLIDMDGDILFAIVDEDKDSRVVFEQLQNSPLWHQLKAVQQEKVYPLILATWRGGNPLAANAVIDDLFRHLVDDRAP
ncbi:MAG: iron-siderophore ABC transporter substrate-binding protein, partial [Cyanobacteria bacterium J06659_2]